MCICSGSRGHSCSAHHSILSHMVLILWWTGQSFSRGSKGGPHQGKDYSQSIDESDIIPNASVMYSPEFMELSTCHIPSGRKFHSSRLGEDHQRKWSCGPWLGKGGFVCDSKKLSWIV